MLCGHFHQTLYTAKQEEMIILVQPKPVLALINEES